MKFCSYWVYTTIPWYKGNWTWEDCETVKDICAVWGTKDAWWKNGDWRWSECSSSIIPPVPPTSSFTASLQPPGVDATTLVQPWLIEPWNPYTSNDEHDKKRKRLIKLICKVKGERYEEEKEVGNMKISVDDIRMVVKKVSDIDLDVNVKNR